jgi:hypothetical protein
VNTTTSFHSNNPIWTQEKGIGATFTNDVVGMGQANDMANSVLVGEKMKQKKKKEKEFQRVKKKQGEKRRRKKNCKGKKKSCKTKIH